MMANGSLPVERIRIPVAGFDISALVARSATHDSKGVIVAIPGGGYDANYWHCEAVPDASLLNLASGLGYTVLALDRPGYGASAHVAAACLPLAAQIDVIFDAIENWRLSQNLTGKIFAMGHSLGGVIGIGLGASERGRMLSAIDVSGVPLKFTDSNQEEMGSWPAEQIYVPPIPNETRRWLMFGPEESYEPRAFEYDCSIVQPMPSCELRDGRRCPETLPAWMKAVAVPIQYTMAESEVSSNTGPAILDLASDLMRGAPRVLTHLQINSGHNISLHKVARAHHLRALAFFDDYSNH